MMARGDGIARGIAAVQTGLVVNAGLALVKFVAGVLGNSYALIADAIESLADIFSSLVVWRGLRIDLHVQASPLLTLQEAHLLGGKVKGAIRRAVPSVSNVLVHMEPFEPT